MFLFCKNKEAQHEKIFAELNAFRPELLCVLVSVAAGVGATLGLPTYLSDIINRGIADKDMNYILHTGVIMLGIAILGMVCNITTGFLPPESRWV